MTRVLRGACVLLAVVAVGGLIEWDPAAGLTGRAEAKPRPPKGPGKGKDHLQKAYEALTDVALWTDAGRARRPRDLAPLVDQARDLYRQAVRAARDDEPQRADELAAAAHDAARGLVHALRAESPAVRGLPAPPPPRDDDELDELLRRTGDRLEDAGRDAPRGAGRAFLDASRRLYEQAQRADRDDTPRAIQLARAAEAWTHVGEHLDRADDRDVRRPEPERREPPRPPRRPGREAPPPPPRD